MVGEVKSTWFVTAIAAAGICLPAGATATGSTSRPLLTFAVGYRFSPGASRAGFAPGGLCASDPQGHIFRVSDPFFDTGPAWSPDGHWIAFSRANDRIFADHVADVFITDAEGRHRRDLTLDKGLDNYGAAWSPDGTKIAYANAWYGSALSVVDAEGGTERRVVEVPYGESIEKPSWSPDGKRLLFTIRSDYEPWASYVIDVDGTNQRK